MISEEWWENNKSHRVGAPNFVKTNPVSGVIVKECWGQIGLFHREEGPAEISRDGRTGIVVFERWWMNGQLHRENGSAEIDRHPETGEITYQQNWVRNASLDGPAIQICGSADEMAASILETIRKLQLRRSLGISP